jgi:hypothetical protein
MIIWQTRANHPLALLLPAELGAQAHDVSGAGLIVAVHDDVRDLHVLRAGGLFRRVEDGKSDNTGT